MRSIKIFDDSSGEIVFEQELGDGHFAIQYVENTNNGTVRRFGKLMNGRFGNKHWIKNYYFEPIAEKLVEKFEEIEHVRPRSILFLENTAWEPGKGKAKKTWIARICNPNPFFQAAWGYSFIIEIKGWFVENLSKEQLIAVLYHELRHIDTDYEIRSHDIEDWGDMVATLGEDYAEKNKSIVNILDEEFEGWYSLRKHDDQMSFEDIESDSTRKVTPLSKASKAVSGNE